MVETQVLWGTRVWRNFEPWRSWRSLKLFITEVFRRSNTWYNWRNKKMSQNYSFWSELNLWVALSCRSHTAPWRLFKQIQRTQKLWASVGTWQAFLQGNRAKHQYIINISRARSGGASLQSGTEKAEAGALQVWGQPTLRTLARA